MAIKKSELYSSLWQSCDELRGGMDASQYKDYVLVLLFVKYVSDKYAGKPDALIVVPPGGSFADMIAAKGQKDIGDRINKIKAKLAEANHLTGVITVADFNDPDKLGKGKEMQDRLSNLIAIFQNPALDFRRNRAEGDDLLGDAYEYLMRNFATQSGKSKGQFYTPAEVSRVIAKVIGTSKATSPNQSIYDPTCGSGSLLLKANDEAPVRLSIYGQEMDNATAALAKMNMILHDNPTAEIWQDNSLSNPYFKQSSGNKPEDKNLKTFDFVVSNPPFSNKAWSNGFNPYEDEYARFTDGVPPRKNGDYAFLLHVIRSLKSNGKGAIILPHGVLFRGNTEHDIRQNIIRKGYIKGIIGLPPNLFFGTGIPACIIVLDKENAANRRGIFLIDASKGFMKDGNKNRLRHRDIHKIVDVFNKQLELPAYSRMVPVAEIEANDYNLNIPRYIDSSEPEDLHDIDAHLRGGIPTRDIDALANYWQVFPTLKQELFTGVNSVTDPHLASGGDPSPVILSAAKNPRVATDTHSAPGAAPVPVTLNASSPITSSAPSPAIPGTPSPVILSAAKNLAHPTDTHSQPGADPVPVILSAAKNPHAAFTPSRPGYATLRVEIAHIKSTIHTHPEFQSYISAVSDWYLQWQTSNIATLKSITIGTSPKHLIETLSEDILRVFTHVQLIDKYDIYQRLMTYWSDTMQDDVYMIAQDGWQANEDLIPRHLIIARYFAADQQHIETLEAAREAITRQMEELDEEHGGEDGLLEDARNDRGKITRTTIKTRLKDILDDPDAQDERIILNAYLDLLDREAEASRKIKEAQKALAEKVAAKYKTLNEDEVKTLVVDDKWLATLINDIQSELNRISQALTGRIRQLAERYEAPLPVLSAEVESLSGKVAVHLERMGFVWQ